MVREILRSKFADFKGVDHQIDTYFKVNKGRLKLRDIENFLVYYIARSRVFYYFKK